MAPSQVVIAASRIAVGLIYAILNLILPICLTLWDLSLTLWNLVAPLRPADRVVPQGRPGANGLWPEYIAPTEKDSRSCCPFLNAMANHGAYLLCWYTVFSMLERVLVWSIWQETLHYAERLVSDKT